MSNGPRRYQVFFAELKRRQVFKMAAVYGAVAFAVMQAADIAFPRLGLTVPAPSPCYPSTT